ncbi:MAG: hypothetical protein ABR555_18570 [Pyrinomonadaceae bacterium]
MIIIVFCAVLLSCLLFTPALGQGQQPAKPSPAKPTTNSTSKEDPNPLALQRRTIALSLLTTLADEARIYQDQSLRARVQARAADALWTSNAEKARSLFLRAWEAADIGDKDAWKRYTDELQRQANSRTSAFVPRPPNLRGEVLRLVTKRDAKLSQRFFSQLKDDATRDVNSALNTDSGAVAAKTADPEDPPAEITQRLSLARELLEEGDMGNALLSGDPALDRVTTRGVFFLSALREKDAVAADLRFANMLTRAVADPTSDAVIVSVLSSYVFTPFLYVIVRGNGNNHTSAERSNTEPPNIGNELRRAFLAGAAQILLRPPQPPDQDLTIAGHRGLYFTIARLLPLYEQFTPELAPELRVQLASLAPDATEEMRTGRLRSLTEGLVSDSERRDEGEDALERAGHTADVADRDELYLRAALLAARKGEISARDILEKLSDTDLRTRSRAYVDFTLISFALQRKNTDDAFRLLSTSDIPAIQRAWALLELANLLKTSDGTRATEVLNEAATVARRISGSDPDRARALVGVATRMFDIDHGRVWEAITEALRSANAVSEFRGEDAQVVVRLQVGGGASTSTFGVEFFDLPEIFSALAKEDLYRTIELARTLTADAPRATATLSIARAILAAPVARPGQIRSRN